MNKEKLDFLAPKRKRNVALWDLIEEQEVERRRKVKFKEFTPLKSERRYIYDTLDFIADHCPSDACIELQIHDYVNYFATLSIRSEREHYYTQAESDSIYELMDLLNVEIFEQLHKKRKKYSFFKRKKPRHGHALRSA